MLRRGGKVSEFDLEPRFRGEVADQRVLRAVLVLAMAASLAAQITGRKKNALYERALEIKNSQS